MDMWPYRICHRRRKIGHEGDSTGHICRDANDDDIVRVRCKAPPRERDAFVNVRGRTHGGRKIQGMIEGRYPAGMIRRQREIPRSLQRD